MTHLAGPAFYDEDEIFNTYWATRTRPDNPNDTLEQPVLRKLAGNLSGRRILDLGCGAATFGLYVLEEGAASYLGVDASQKMVAAACEALAGTPGQVIEAAIETWEYPEAGFDLVVSSLALHYVDDLDAVMTGIARALAPGGRVVFSVEHPIITSCARGWTQPQRQDWVVDDYFVTGPRETSWLGGEVVRYHRTIEDYVTALQTAGFVLDALRESRPDPARFTDEAEYTRRLRIPLFLFLAGYKPETLGSAGKR
ncbi:MAG: methyltransferase domain-containing protein [Thermomicrobiales bacterium]